MRRDWLSSQKRVFVMGSSTGSTSASIFNVGVGAAVCKLALLNDNVNLFNQRINQKQLSLK